MGYIVCIWNPCPNLFNTTLIVEVFKTRYPEQQFILAESIDDIVSLEPPPNLVITTYVTYYHRVYGWTNHPNHALIIPKIKHLNVIHFKIEFQMSSCEDHYSHTCSFVDSEKSHYYTPTVGSFYITSNGLRIICFN